MPATPRRAAGYPGRDQLDSCNRQFRRAVARLHREGLKDPETAAKLAPIISAAVAALNDLTAQAVKAEGQSARHRAALAKEQEKTEHLLKRAARQGSLRAARMLADGRFQRPGGDDAA